jgi:uracil-DNA glycosylase
LSRTIEDLIELVRNEATSGEFSVDRLVYERTGKDPHQPILYAGSLSAAVCIMGRDLGKDEVRLGQPLIGAGGKLVRQGILRVWDSGNPGNPRTGGTLEDALQYALLTNTVPFKPPGNKAYSEAVKERFRPFLLEFLTRFWSGHHVITLGSEAFRWFQPYGKEEEFRGRGVTDRRFTSGFLCSLTSPQVAGDGRQTKEVTVLPLPHPSPLNRRWRARFPSLLDQRLSEVLAAHGRALD